MKEKPPTAQTQPIRSASDSYPVPLLTVEELHTWLRVKISTIRKWTCYNKIPCVRIGRSVRYRRADIEEWLATKEAWPSGLRHLS